MTKRQFTIWLCLYILIAVALLFIGLTIRNAKGAQLQHATVSVCDDALWKRTYNPQRLKVNEVCVTVTGVIVDATNGKRKDGVRHEADGDCHGWLKLDPGQERFLNAGNMSDEGGNLVYEIVHIFKATQKDAIASGVGYTNKVQLAPVGSHVAITGAWVTDMNHAKWNEIHPVSSITIIKER